VVVVEYQEDDALPVDRTYIASSHLSVNRQSYQMQV
jgi:hypothetical protein